jgi:endonuclease G
MPELNPEVEAAYETAVHRYLHREDVTGVDYGIRMVQRKPVPEEGWCIRIHVREKFPDTTLTDQERIPAEIGGVPTDVVQAVYTPYDGRLGGFTVDPARMKARGILRPGISIGHQSGTTGTLGLFVRHKPTGQVMVLGCAHVMAPSGAAPGDKILQPSLWDNGNSDGDLIGRIRFRNQRVDGALAALDTVRRVEVKPYGSGRSITGVRQPRVGDILEKSGRTTSVTQALVTGVGTFPGVSHGFSLTTLPTETEDIEISHDGDSGAIWYDPETGEGVGMLVQGEDIQNPFKEWAIASSLVEVLESLHAELWDGTDLDE